MRLALFAVLVSTVAFAQTVSADAPTADPLPISVQRKLEVRKRVADLNARASVARGLKIGGFGTLGAAGAAMIIEALCFSSSPFLKNFDTYKVMATTTAIVAVVGLVVGLVGTGLGSGVDDDRSALQLELTPMPESWSKAPSVRLLPDPLALY